MQEIDYTLEGESADRFRKNFGADDWLKVPSIFWERTTSEVLTMEYCPGVKINRISELDKMGVDRKRLARLAVESYLQQILTHGFFHAGEPLPRLQWWISGCTKGHFDHNPSEQQAVRWLVSSYC